MKKIIPRIIPCSIYDMTAFAQWLDTQCKKGLLLRNVLFGFAFFVKTDRSDSYTVHLQSIKGKVPIESVHIGVVTGTYRVCYVKGNNAPVVDKEVQVSAPLRLFIFSIFCVVLLALIGGSFKTLTHVDWKFLSFLCLVLFLLVHALTFLPGFVSSMRGRLWPGLYCVCRIVSIILFILMLCFRYILPAVIGT